jgi:hypothetical protein
VNTVNYGRIADEIIRSLRPRSVFDAGCCRGLADALRDRGVSVLAGPLTNGPDRCDLITCLNVTDHLPEERVFAGADTVLFSSAAAEATDVLLREFAGRGFSPDIAYDAGYAAPDAMLLRRAPALPPDVVQLFSECLRLRRAAAGHERLQEDFEGLRRLQQQLMKDARELSARVVTRHEQAAVSAEQLAELEARLRKGLAGNQDVSSEVRRIAADVAELRGRTAQLDRRTTEIDGVVRGLSAQVESMLQSRVWRALVSAGGLLLRVSGRK